MQQDLAKALRFSVPMILASLILLGFHLLFHYTFRWNILSTNQILVNYLLLTILFGAGQLIAVTEWLKGPAMFKRANKKTARQRLFLASAFILFASMTASSPVLFSLHFIVPYFLLSGYEFLRLRALQRDHLG